MVPWPAPSVLMGRPLESAKIHGKGSGKKRKLQRAHHDEKWGQRRLETAGDARSTAAVRWRFLLALKGESRGEVRGNGEGRGRLVRGALQNIRGAGVEEGERGGAGGLAVPELGEREGAGAVEGEG